jgi:hypothetical protein
MDGTSRRSKQVVPPLETPVVNRASGHLVHRAILVLRASFFLRASPSRAIPSRATPIRATMSAPLA